MRIKKKMNMRVGTKNETQFSITKTRGFRGLRNETCDWSIKR